MNLQVQTNHISGRNEKRMAQATVADISLGAPASVVSVATTKCRPRTASALLSKVNAIGQKRPQGVPGWLVALFVLALLVSIAALVLIVTVRNDLVKLSQGQATISSIRQKFRFASLMTYLTYILVLAIVCVLIINKNSFLRYGLVSVIALVFLLAQAVLLQGSIDDAIIVVLQSKSDKPPVDVRVGTFATALSALTTVALLIGLILAATDNRQGKTDDDLFNTPYSMQPSAGIGSAVGSRSVTLESVQNVVAVKEPASATTFVPVVTTKQTGPLIPVAETTSTVIGTCPPQQPTRTVIVEKIVPVEPVKPPLSPAAASFDQFLSSLGKPAGRAASYVVPIAG